MHVQFSGDPTDWTSNVRAALEREFDVPEFVGLVETALSYTAGSGFQIVYARLFVPGVGAVDPGGSLPTSEIRDYRAEVRRVLERAGAPLA
jgi:hypothetical protein